MGTADLVCGGGKRDRTDDLLHAMQALSQLSYTPTREARIIAAPQAIQNRSSRRVSPRLTRRFDRLLNVFVQAKDVAFRIFKPSRFLRSEDANVCDGL